MNAVIDFIKVIQLGKLFSISYVKNTVKKRLVYQFEQSWNATIQNSSKCILYRTHKRKFEFENYLISIPQ